jgi:hypothetical protein
MSLDSAALPSDYDYDGNYKDHRENLAEWVAILRASESNPTLKELVDQLRVLYNASKKPEPQPVFQKDVWQGTVTADDSYEMIFEPTQTGP